MTTTADLSVPTLMDRVAAAAARLTGLREHPQIDTARLRLRAPKAADVDAVYTLFSNPDVMRYWSRGPMQRRSEAEAYVRTQHENFARREAIGWIVADRDSDAMLGTCSLYDMQPRHLRSGIGYAVLPSQQQRGYATEAVRAATPWAFDTLHLHRLEADTHPDNEASARVLERLGYRCEGTLRDRFLTEHEIQDSRVYALLEDEFAAERERWP